MVQRSNLSEKKTNGEKKKGPKIKTGEGGVVVVVGGGGGGGKEKRTPPSRFFF